MIKPDDDAERELEWDGGYPDISYNDSNSVVAYVSAALFLHYFDRDFGDSIGWLRGSYGNRYK